MLPIEYEIYNTPNKVEVQQVEPIVEDNAGLSAESGVIDETEQQ